MNEAINAQLKELRDYQGTHVQVARNMLKAGGGAGYLLDILATAVLNRSLALLSGFCSLIEARNFICAAPLIRLQIDNCLRFYAASLVRNEDSFVRDILRGIPVRKLKDRNNKPMTDKFLVDKLSEKHFWLARVYAETSGYVHLSEKHIISSIRASESEKDFTTIRFKVSMEDADLEDEVYLGAIHAFKVITDLLLEYLRNWTCIKDNSKQI